MSLVASVLIEGNYVDSYLYGGLLLAWDDQGRLIIASTEALAAAAADAASTPRRVARAAFVDNKQLGDPAALGRLRRSALSEARNGDGAVTHLELGDLQPKFFAVAPDAHVLDLMVTYSRLFISTDDGLFSVTVDADEVGDVQRRLPHRCLSTTPKWGAVSASCADAGAWALLHEIEIASGRRPRAAQINEAVSIHHAWLGSSLLSFDDKNRVDLFKATVRKEEGAPRFIEGFSPADDHADLPDVGWWFSFDQDTLGFDEADFVTAFTGLLVAAHRGLVLATRVSTWSGSPHPIGEVERLARIDGRVLSIADTEAGFVVETDDELHYVTDYEPIRLLARETISLRAYPRSKRHRRTVTATVDGGLLITALLGAHPLPHDERWVYPPR